MTIRRKYLNQVEVKRLAIKRQLRLRDIYVPKPWYYDLKKLRNLRSMAL
jgi:hypothetical protein